MENEPKIEEDIIPEEEDVKVEEATETPTLEEYNKLLKDNKTLKFQKDHFKNKLEKKEKEKTEEVSVEPDGSSSNFMSRDEAVLIAEGYDIEDLDQLKAIQKGKDLKSIKEAMETPLFKSYHKDKLAEKKSKDASLGASGGSGGEESEAKPDMTDKEHRELWAKSYKK